LAMAVVIIEGAITPEQVVLASEEYGEYVKVVVDIEKGFLAAGGEWHADAERVLLERGSKQEFLWGGGINLAKKKIDFVSLINMRPGVSSSQEVMDQAIRNKMETIIKRTFGL